MAKSELDARATTDGQRRANGLRQPAPASRAEAQLRARVGELESQLVEIAGRLELAERRAADELLLQGRVRFLEAQLEVFKGTRSWRITAPLRSSGRRARRVLGR